MRAEIDITPYLLTDGGALDYDACPDCWEKRAHRERYEFACSVMRGMRVLDFGCGTGYGSEWLSKVNTSVVGYEPARQITRGGFVLYTDHLWDWDEFDGCVALEVLEHLEHPRNFIEAVPCRHLVASVPVGLEAMQNPHHKTPFSELKFLSMLAARFTVKTVWRQIQPFHYDPCVIIAHAVARYPATKKLMEVEL